MWRLMSNQIVRQRFGLYQTTHKSVGGKRENGGKRANESERLSLGKMVEHYSADNAHLGSGRVKEPRFGLVALPKCPVDFHEKRESAG